MSLIFNEEKKLCRLLLHMSNKIKLRDFKEKGFKKVDIFSGNGCKNCRKLNGKILTIDEALRTMPLPNKNCTHILYNENESFCTCKYEPIFTDKQTVLDDM
jgi:hypothetical protein